MPGALRALSSSSINKGSMSSVIMFVANNSKFAVCERYGVAKVVTACASFLSLMEQSMLDQ